MIGIFTRTFETTDLERSLSTVAALGFDGAHLSLASAGLGSFPAALSEAEAQRIGTIVERSPVALYGVSATFNATNPDRERLRRDIEAAVRIIGLAPVMGTSFVTLCTGSMNADDMWAFHPDNAGEAAWDRLIETLAPLSDAARAAGVTLGVEPEINNVVSDAARARRLLDEYPDFPLKIVLDPTNLVELGDDGAVRETLVEAFSLLAKDVAVVHAKDKDASGASRAVGRGGMPYELIADLIHEHGLSALPIVTHELDAGEAAHACAFIRSNILNAEDLVR